MSKQVYYISIGSNLGDRAANLELALRALAAVPGARVAARSAFAETEPVDVAPEHRALKFLNCAAAVESDLAPHAMLAACAAAEKALGRVRPAPRNAPRTVDIDLVCAFGPDGRPVAVDDPPVLVLPHPRARLRAFVMDPLREIAPAAADWLLRGGARAPAPSAGTGAAP